MNNEKGYIETLKKHKINTRLHTAPVFATYKPSNEKAKQNVLYRGATEWNKLSTKERNLNINEFKKLQKNQLVATYT